ncbi:ScbA/BarX family gamma-butyrolactone biosynthesis protein [Streptomyces sp. NPDC048290]|uniref:ScbA/BarX family gamma-butyrolactone biosynthesis protein n=1 Tax=Streptomyces sp. NPDC048290 TaxID=3155811 RepID=UPI0034249A8C
MSWSRTVPREMVHRTSVAEVLLTDVRRMDETRFEAAACWPRSHPTFPLDGPAVHHPLLIAETLRQLGIYIPLRYFGVAPDARLLITDLSFTVDPMAQPRTERGATQIDCRVRADGLRTERDGTAAGLRLGVEFRADGVVFARAGGGARFLSARRYAALRGPLAHAGQPAPAAGLLRPDPALLGVAHPRDVVIGLLEAPEDSAPSTAGPVKSAPSGPVPSSARQVVTHAADPWHPFFFDHATDHVPGMVLLEAARQAAALASGGELVRLTGARLTALRFTEFAPPARVVAVPHHRTCVFRFEQGGEQRAVGALRFGSPDRV